MPVALFITLNPLEMYMYPTTLTIESENKLGLILQDSSNRQFKNTWAFAIDRSNFNSRRQQLADLRDCVISSCSKDAKRLGVYAGMRYSDAIALIPDMRILVIGGVNV